MCFQFSRTVRPRLGKILFGSSTSFAGGLSAGLLGLLLIGVSIAQAAPLFTATVGYASGGYPTLTNNGPTAVEATLNSSVPFGNNATDTKNQFAAAGPSGLRASARVTLSAAYTGTVPSEAGASDIGTADAKMLFDDLHFRGFNGDRSGTTLASLNLDLSGTFLTNVNAFFDPYDPVQPQFSAGASTFTAVQVSVTVPNVLFGGTPQAQSFTYFQNRDTSGTFIGSLFDSGRITTQPFSFYNGVNNQLIVELFVRVQGSAGGYSTSFDAFADALVDFSHTVTFANSGPVFNIPDGYSVNSVEAQITDNAFVPEPAGLTLLGMGAVGLLCGRRLLPKNESQNSFRGDARQ